MHLLKIRDRCCYEFRNSCALFVSDVEIKDRDGRDGSVTISKMESDNVSVHLEHGDCNLNSLKVTEI